MENTCRFALPPEVKRDKNNGQEQRKLVSVTVSLESATLLGIRGRSKLLAQPCGPSVESPCRSREGTGNF